MPRPSKPTASEGGKNDPNSSSTINDPRFSNIQTDPRFRLPSRNTSHVKLDKRFSHMLRDDDFSKKASVDRYGRRIPKGEGKKELQRLYEVEEDEDEDEDDDDEEIDDDEDVRKELARVEHKYDPARQGGFSESSSDEDDESEDSEDEEAIDSADQAENGELGGLEEEIPMGEISSRIAIVNLDWDNIRAVDIMAVATSFSPPDGRILNVTVYPSEFGRERMEREDLEGPPPELFVSKSGGGEDDQSEYEDMSEVDENSDSEEDSDERIKSNILAKSTANTAEVEPHALRAYQLSRMRYFYGVITCDSPHTGSTLYNAMDGREYLSSANFFDMRFIPDSVTFDDPVTDKPRDQCTSIPDGYRPKEFVTEALTHSKVHLTWDEDDPSRKEVQKRAFSRQEVDENDLKAYVGSDSDDDESEEEAGNEVDGASNTKSATKDKASAARDKLRAALGLPLDSASSSKSTSSKKTKSKVESGSGPVGDMQITFTAGLSTGSTPASVFENKPEDVKEETTREAYVRKEKERKARRKAKAKAARDGVPFEENADGDAEDAATDLLVKSTGKHQGEETANGDLDEDDPFNDPFFTDPAAANAAAKKAAKAAKRLASAEEAAASAARKQREKEELELLMAGEDGEGLSGGKGFDMAEIRKAEKEEAKRGKKKSKKQKQKEAKKDVEKAEKADAGDDFEIDVKDPRFSGVFESHEFAIDPSNPRFSGTKGMKKLLEQGRKNRDVQGGSRAKPVQDGNGEGRVKEGKRKTEGSTDDLEVLVNKVKRRKAV